MEQLAKTLILLTGLLVIVSCASTSEYEGEQVSTMPWNKPAGWEGQGALGGMMGGQN